MLYKGHKTAYYFKKLKRMRTFRNAIKNGIATMYMASHEQNPLPKRPEEFISNTRRPNNPKMEREKQSVQNNEIELLKGREMVHKPFEIGVFLSLLNNCKQSEQSEQ